jgi:hypothetical protein
MVNVTDRADVAVRLVAFKFCFGHLLSQFFGGAVSGCKKAAVG